MDIAFRPIGLEGQAEYNRLLSLCADQGLAGRSLADALAAGGRLVTRPHFNLRPQTRRG